MAFPGRRLCFLRRLVNALLLCYHFWFSRNLVLSQPPGNPDIDDFFINLLPRADPSITISESSRTTAVQQRSWSDPLKIFDISKNRGCKEGRHDNASTTGMSGIDTKL